MQAWGPRCSLQETAMVGAVAKAHGFCKAAARPYASSQTSRLMNGSHGHCAQHRAETSKPGQNQVLVPCSTVQGGWASRAAGSRAQAFAMRTAGASPGCLEPDQLCEHPDVDGHVLTAKLDVSSGVHSYGLLQTMSCDLRNIASTAIAIHTIAPVVAHKPHCYKHGETFRLTVHTGAV